MNQPTPVTPDTHPQLCLHGHLDFSAHTSVRDGLRGLPPHFSNLTIQLDQVTGLDGAGLGLLLLIHELCTERNARLHLMGAGPEIQRILDLSGFTKLLNAE